MAAVLVTKVPFCPTVREYLDPSGKAVLLDQRPRHFAPRPAGNLGHRSSEVVQ